MGWWLAPCYDRLLAAAEAGPLGRWRAELLEEASGHVLEVGAGTGANLPWYPDVLEHLTLCEPDPGMASQLRAKMAVDPAYPIDVNSAAGERLPAADSSQDVVVSTLVLCSVTDLDGALAEVRRVLKDGGRFLFLEHVADEGRPFKHALQRAATPVWKRIAGGCCLDRPIGDHIRAAGFDVTAMETRTFGRRGGLASPFLWGHGTAPIGGG